MIQASINADLEERISRLESRIADITAAVKRLQVHHSHY